MSGAEGVEEVLEHGQASSPAGRHLDRGRRSGLRQFGGDRLGPRAASGPVGISRSGPSAGGPILAMAVLLNASATTNSATPMSPWPRTFIGLSRVGPARRPQDLWLTVIGAGFEPFLPAGVSPSSNAELGDFGDPPDVHDLVLDLNRFLKPRSFDTHVGV